VVDFNAKGHFLSLKIFFGGGATVREVRCSPTSQPFQKRDY
jgi:hypothetical protein